MASILNKAKENGWVVVDGITYRYRYNEVRKKIFLENFRMVREKLAGLQEKDYVRLLQPVIDGNEIMELFHLKPSREVGVLKQYLKDAVLDNRVENEREPLMQLLMQKAKDMKLI